MAAPKFTKELTELLNKIGSEAHTMNNDGEVITKNEALIKLLWDTALGYTEMAMVESGKDKGTMREVKHKPQKWAMELIYNRKEGGLANTSDVNESGISAAKQVRQLAKDRSNKMARKIAGTEEQSNS